MNTLTKNQRITKLEAQVSELQKILSVTDKPVLNQLDQSVFNGLDKQWQWAAVDEDGECFVFVEKPWTSNIMTFYWSSNDDLKIGDNYDTTNWQDSLIKREAEELTDNELTKDYFYSNMVYTLLTNGSNYVLAYVSDISEADAIKNKQVEIIESVDVLFNETDGGDWKYAVPINNQGEPLTASEVGL